MTYGGPDPQCACRFCELVAGPPLSEPDELGLRIGADRATRLAAAYKWREQRQIEARQHGATS